MDTSFYGQKMIEEAVVPTAPRTGKAGSADESAAKGGRRGEDSPKGSAAPKPALPLCGAARGVKKMKGWPPFIASRKFVCYFFDSLKPLLRFSGSAERCKRYADNHYILLRGNHSSWALSRS